MECVSNPLLVSYSQNNCERALTCMSGFSKIVRFAESGFSGVAKGRIKGRLRPPLSQGSVLGFIEIR